MLEVKDRYFGRGKRKSSVARALIKKSNSNQDKIIVNGIDMNSYWEKHYRPIVLLPMQVMRKVEEDSFFECHIIAKSGGKSGQAGATQLAISKALLSYNEGLRSELRTHKLLTTDSRRVEPKRYGHTKSRAKQAFNKR